MYQQCCSAEFPQPSPCSLLLIIVHVIHALNSAMDGGINVCSMHLDALHLNPKRQHTVGTNLFVIFRPGYLLRYCVYLVHV